ncbi:MAG: glutathione S-transferase family protein [Bacteriovorax sp.]|nr:glutathione S-transferase family protein [Bacteriovorax sp.]
MELENTIPVLFYIPGTCAFGSIVALEWLGMPFRLCRLDGTSIKLEAYLKLNPLSQVPVFKSKDGVLAESAAILQHIGFLGLDKGMAYKQGTQKYDHLNQVMSFLTTSLHTSIGPTIHPDRSADSQLAQQEVVHKAKTETIPARFKHIEQMMNNYGWLAGDHPTIADAYFYGVARAAKEFINLEKDFPKTASFFLRFKSNPGVIFAQAIEDQKPPKSSVGFKGEVTLSELV